MLSTRQIWLWPMLTIRHQCKFSSELFQGYRTRRSRRRTSIGRRRMLYGTWRRSSGRSSMKESVVTARNTAHTSCTYASAAQADAHLLPYTHTYVCFLLYQHAHLAHHVLAAQAIMMFYPFLFLPLRISLALHDPLNQSARTSRSACISRPS